MFWNWKPVSFSISRMGISVKYTCYCISKRGGNACPDKKSDKCYRCKYAVAEMPAEDATKLLNVFTKSVTDKYTRSKQGEEKV